MLDEVNGLAEILRVRKHKRRFALLAEAQDGHVDRGTDNKLSLGIVSLQCIHARVRDGQFALVKARQQPDSLLSDEELGVLQPQPVDCKLLDENGAILSGRGERRA